MGFVPLRNQTYPNYLNDGELPLHKKSKLCSVKDDTFQQDIVDIVDEDVSMWWHNWLFCAVFCSLVV